MKKRSDFLSIIFWIFIATFLFFLSSCSAQKKLDKCEKWAAENPQTFESFKDTLEVEIIREVKRRDTAGYIYVDSLENKPVYIDKYGVKVGLKLINNKLHFNAVREARTDTITKKVPVTKWEIQPRPKWWKNRFFYGGLIIGFVVTVLTFWALIDMR